MGIKAIFQNGMKDLKRRTRLMKEKSSLSVKERQLLEQLKETGRKAWESKLIIADTELVEHLKKTEKEAVELRKQSAEREELLKNKKEWRKSENEKYEMQRKEAEEKKKGIDLEWNGEKAKLTKAQSEIERIQKRLKQVSEEAEKLKSDPNMLPVDKEKKTAEITNSMDMLERELPGHQQDASSLPLKIKPLEEKSQVLHSEINRIRQEQKTALGNADKEISELQKQIGELKQKSGELNKHQEENYLNLGKSLATLPSTPMEIQTEMGQVQILEKEKAEIQTAIDRLVTEGEALPQGTLTKMIGLILLGIILLIAIIWGITELTRPKKENTWPYINQINSEAGKKNQNDRILSGIPPSSI